MPNAALYFQDIFDGPHRQFAQSLLETAFPPVERPPFEVLMHRDRGQYTFNVLMTADGDKPVGILTYSQLPGFLYVEHFAISEQYRGKGYGSMAFGQLLEMFDGQVLGEVEPATDDLSRRRIEFYKRLGLTQNPQPYLQPSYHSADVRVPLHIFSRYALSDSDFETVRKTIYTQIYRCQE